MYTSVPNQKNNANRFEGRGGGEGARAGGGILRIKQEDKGNQKMSTNKLPIST